MMLATRYRDTTDPTGWLMSEKLNGWRAFWDGYVLRSRTWRIIPVPAVITQFLPVGIALDGEIHAGRGGFSVIQSLCQSGRMDDPRWADVRYTIFDFPTTELMKIEERVVLARKFAVGPQVGFALQTVVENTAALWSRFKDVVTNGGEGLVIKRAGSYYDFDLSSDWQKVKPAGVS